MGSVKFQRDKKLESMLESLEFYEYTYDGGEEYVDEYLIRHERESDEAYNRRKSEACVINLCAPVIDLYNFYLYRSDPVREYGNLETNKLFQLFQDDADFYGNRYKDVISGISLQGSIYGIYGVIVDKPAIAATSMGEEIAKNVRPYLATYEPEAIWGMDFERIGGGKPTLIRLVLEEEDGKLRVWTRDEIAIWRKIEGTKDEYELDSEPLVNVLGDIPFVLHKNRMTLEQFDVASDIADLAPIQRAIFNDDSKMREAMSRAAFPMMEIPDSSMPMANPASFTDGGLHEQEVVVGTGNALIRSNGDTIGHRYVEPSMTGVDKYMLIRQAHLNDFNAIARTTHANATARQTQSGVALEIEFQQLNALLASKAACMERTEERILGFVAKWLNTEFDGQVIYDDSFGIRDLAHDIDAAIKSLSVITSPTYKNEVAKQLAARILDDDTAQEVIDSINSELATPNTLTAMNALGVTGA